MLEYEIRIQVQVRGLTHTLTHTHTLAHSPALELGLGSWRVLLIGLRQVMASVRVRVKVMASVTGAPVGLLYGECQG